MLESKENIRNLNNDQHIVLKFMNDFKTKLGYFEWTAEEIKLLKNRQTKIIFMLSEKEKSSNSIGMGRNSGSRNAENIGELSQESSKSI